MPTPGSPGGSNGSTRTGVTASPRPSSESRRGRRPSDPVVLTDSEFELVPAVESLLEVLDVLEEDHLLEKRFAELRERDQREAELLLVQPCSPSFRGCGACVGQNAVVASDRGEARLIRETVCVVHERINRVELLRPGSFRNRVVVTPSRDPLLHEVVHFHRDTMLVRFDRYLGDVDVAQNCLV